MLMPSAMAFGHGGSATLLSVGGVLDCDVNGWGVSRPRFLPEACASVGIAHSRCAHGRHANACPQPLKLSMLSNCFAACSGKGL